MSASRPFFRGLGARTRAPEQVAPSQSLNEGSSNSQPTQNTPVESISSSTRFRRETTFRATEVGRNLHNGINTCKQKAKRVFSSSRSSGEKAPSSPPLSPLSKSIEETLELLGEDPDALRMQPSVAATADSSTVLDNPQEVVPQAFTGSTTAHHLAVSSLSVMPEETPSSDRAEMLLPLGASLHHDLLPRSDSFDGNATAATKRRLSEDTLTSSTTTEQPLLKRARLTADDAKTPAVEAIGEQIPGITDHDLSQLAVTHAVGFDLDQTPVDQQASRVVAPTSVPQDTVYDPSLLSGSPFQTPAVQPSGNQPYAAHPPVYPAIIQPFAYYFLPAHPAVFNFQGPSYPATPPAANQASVVQHPGVHPGRQAHLPTHNTAGNAQPPPVVQPHATTSTGAQARIASGGNYGSTLRNHAPVTVTPPMGHDITIVEIMTFNPNCVQMPEVANRFMRNGLKTRDLAKMHLHPIGQLTKAALKTSTQRLKKQFGDAGQKLYPVEIAANGGNWNQSIAQNKGQENRMTANHWLHKCKYAHSRKHYNSENFVHVPLSHLYGAVPPGNWPVGSDRGVLTQCLEYAYNNPHENLTTADWDMLINREQFVAPTVDTQGWNRDVYDMWIFNEVVDDPTN